MLMLEHFTMQFITILIYVIDIIGVAIVFIGVTKSFIGYVKDTILKRNLNSKVKVELAQSMALGLEFKMAAEILKTVLVQSMSELAILGSIILLRALLTFLIHIELKSNNNTLVE